MDLLLIASISFPGAVKYLCYVLPLTFLAYCIADAISTRQLVRKQSEHSLVGSPFGFFWPKFILNVVYAWKATKLAEEGYEKYQNSAFQLIRNEGRVLVLPLSLLEEVSRLPSNIAESTAALERDLVGSFTGVDLILESRLHHSIVQRKLTPRLPLLLPRMEEAVTMAFTNHLPQGEEWTEFQPYKALSYVSARLGAEVIVGPAFCDNPKWLHVAVEYTENLFRTVVVLRCFPKWMHPVLSRVLPSYWEGWRLLRGGQRLLGPKIQELLDKNNAGTWQPQDDKPEDLNVLSWLASLAKGRDRNADVIGHVLVMVALAAVHTTLLRMVNVLYDVVNAGPQLQKELLDEIAVVAARGWHDNGNPYDALEKLDSVLRESQRMSPPTTLGMKRLFKESYTFQDGTHVRRGTYACLPVFAIENDRAKVPNPEEFDGLRAYRAARQGDAGPAGEYLFSSPGPSFLNFGYGKTACPGRFFASVVVKMVIAKALTDYEFKFLPGTERPKNIIAHEFLFTWPWTRMLVRRKKSGSCPF
ncbi:Ent-kaurene oxidase [Cytospora mali]|uniref:Ent-kaurene oxidase n=1 Tax=Cytospora mali TaxID=578113 RepID=A0A194UYK7_CYTMA|nr:Ent-kaurene oxidase [Valsa mali var. pyri (nom. inval.)]